MGDTFALPFFNYTIHGGYIRHYISRNGHGEIEKSHFEGLEYNRYRLIIESWCDTQRNSNYKDDGMEYYIYEEADVDDDDDFYGDIPPMLGDIWIDEDVDDDDSDEFM